MGSSNFKGMDTYNRIITEARATGKPIGPQFHKLDLQRKLWEKQQGLLTQTREPKSVVVSSPSNSTTREALKAKVVARVSVPREPSLREKYQAEQIKKIADGYKVEEKIQYVSRGNGL
jgi:hypothetical protein